MGLIAEEVAISFSLKTESEQTCRPRRGFQCILSPPHKECLREKSKKISKNVKNESIAPSQITPRDAPKYSSATNNGESMSITADIESLVTVKTAKHFGSTTYDRIQCTQHSSQCLPNIKYQCQSSGGCLSPLATSRKQRTKTIGLRHAPKTHTTTCCSRGKRETTKYKTNIFLCQQEAMLRQPNYTNHIHHVKCETRSTNKADTYWQACSPRRGRSG